MRKPADLAVKGKAVIAVVLIAGALLVWNLFEYRSMEPDVGRIPSRVVEIDPDTPRFDWKWCDKVEVEVVNAACRILSLPPELEALEGREVIVAGPSFACGEDLVQHQTGYTINGFILVPYFGMIDCCIGNPIPYFQWTIVVEKLVHPWQIRHKGIIDPNVVVRGTFRIQRGDAFEGIFFLDEAEVIDSAEHQAELANTGT